MSFSRKTLPRRTLLRGMGAGLALPFLEAMCPSSATADAASRPRRLQVFYTPNGMMMDDFRPKPGAAPDALPPTLAPLAPFRGQMTLITGLGHPMAAAMGDRPAGHGRSCPAFLTGVHVRQTEGSDIRCGVSMDQVFARALGDASMPGSIAALIRRSQIAGQSLRQRFARDFWRMVNHGAPRIEDEHPQTLLELAGDLIERSSALAGQVAENMTRGPGWLFLDMGRRLERALAICRLTRQLALADEASQDDPDALGVLLELCDSQVTYRSRYLTGAMRLPVLDLVVFDPDNPRSLAFQVERLCNHIAALPRIGEDNAPEPALREARLALAPLQTGTVEDVDADWLLAIEARLMSLSDTISARYFLPSERPESATPGELLA